MTHHLETFRKAAADPFGTATTIKTKMIGHMCSYTPEEMIHAAGFHPFRMFSSKPEIMLAENHLQAYCCSLVRGVLEDSLSGRLDFLEGAVFPHTCDSIQRLSDIWRMKNKTGFFADVMVPSKLNTRSAREYMVEVLERFKTELETRAEKRITNDDIEASIRLFNQIRRSLSKIYELHQTYPGVLKNQDLYALVKGAMVMEREKTAAFLPDIISHLTSSTRSEKKLKPVVLTGTICDSAGVFKALDDAGALVASDDLCTGRRWFDGEVAAGSKDPVEAIADRYMDRVTCPAKHAGITSRAEKILSLVEQTKAQGVVFVRLKFCDPHAFDYPYIKAEMDKAGIKMLLIEMDDLQGNQGQLSTRIETFIHMI